MADTVCSKCRDTNKLAIFFQCRRCDCPQHKLCNQLCFSSEEDVPYEFYNACLDEDSLQRETKLLKQLPAEDFTKTHHRDTFCIDCRVAFCAAVCQDHVDHRSINIVKKCGRHFVRFEEEKWTRKFNYVMERREGYRLLPLMEGQNGCDCTEICGTMFYCSIHHVVRSA